MQNGKTDTMNMCKINVKRKAEATRIIKRAFIAIGICGISLWMTGCTDETAQEPENMYNVYMAGGMEETPVVDYPVPQPLPNVLTDSRGYSAGSVKKAFVTGRELPDTFTLVDEGTGKAVYYGAIEDKAYNAELALYVGYADFTQVDQPGSYYVECDIVGQSYRFAIKEQLYPELFRESYGEIIKDCESGSLSVMGAIRLLGTYEWYGELFPDQNHNNIPDVLEKLQGWVAHIEENGAGAGQEALYAAFLAKYSYNLKKYDFEYATECLKRAAAVFGQAQDGAGRDADAFYALTELFRATGLNTYHDGIRKYKSIFEDNRTYLEEGYLYGSMTYLTTRQQVDAALCEEMIYTVISKGEEISEQYQSMIAPAPSGGNAPADLMKYVSNLSCANYILNIYQYTSIIEECLHFLMGRNPESVDYYENAEDRTAYLVWFAQLTAFYEDMMGEK